MAPKPVTPKASPKPITPTRSTSTPNVTPILKTPPMPYRKHQHPIRHYRPKSPAIDPCELRKPTHPAPVFSGTKPDVPSLISMPVIIINTPQSSPTPNLLPDEPMPKSPLHPIPKPTPVITITNATELSKLALSNSVKFPTPKTARVPKVCKPENKKAVSPHFHSYPFH